MTQAKDLLNRGDLVGGEIQKTVGSKTLRAKIERVGFSRKTVVFQLTETLKWVGGEEGWRQRVSLKRISVRADTVVLGTSSPQIDIKGGFIVIFPRGDRNVIQ